MVGGAVKNNVKPRSNSKSPARAASPSRRGRKPSPARKTSSPPRKTSSPPRSPKRNASPARRASPARTSPGRGRPAKPKPNNTTTPEKKKEPKRSPPRQARPKKIVIPDSESGSDSEVESLKKIDLNIKPLKTRISRLDVLDAEPVGMVHTFEEIRTSSLGLLRRSARSQNRELDRIVHLKATPEGNAKKLGEFSDEDEVLTKKTLLKPQLSTEFGGTLGAVFLIIFTTISIIILHAVCDQYTCSFIRLPNLQKFKFLSTWFDLQAFLVYLGYFTGLALLAALPFGGRKVQGLPNKAGKLTYNINGLFSFIVICAVLGGLEVKGLKVADFIVEHLFHLLISAMIIGYLLALHVFVRSFYVPISELNPEACNRNAIYGFFMGREVNPRIAGVVDMKMYVLRLSIIGSLIINFAYLYKTLSTTLKPTGPTWDWTNINWPTTLLLFILINSTYLMDALIFEDAWVTSFEVNQEGFGFMGAVGYSIYPFMCASVVKYIVEYNVRFALWKLAIILALFSVGYTFFRGSNSQKNAFRQNPYSPALSHLKTMPTNQGKKLLISGFWGIVRHPNYLGDILVQLSFCPFVLCAPPVITYYSIILLLLHRSVRDNARCKQKYGSSWDRYCSTVRYVLIPKIY